MTKTERQRLREITYDMLTSGKTPDDVINLASRLHSRGEIVEQINIVKGSIDRHGKALCTIKRKRI